MQLPYEDLGVHWDSKNKFVHRYLAGVKNPCIDCKDCILIFIGFCLSMRVFDYDWASLCSLGVVNVVDCASMSLVMDCTPSTIICAANTNGSWSNDFWS